MFSFVLTGWPRHICWWCFPGSCFWWRSHCLWLHMFCIQGCGEKQRTHTHTVQMWHTNAHPPLPHVLSWVFGSFCPVRNRDITDKSVTKQQHPRVLSRLLWGAVMWLLMRHYQQPIYTHNHSDEVTKNLLQGEHIWNTSSTNQRV